jgi:hypothetical protein
MYDNQLFASGVYGVLIVDWNLRCETPLAVSNGVKIAYQTNDQLKSRGQASQFHWRNKGLSNKKEYEVATLHYGYRIEEGNKLAMIHFIPPSSVRGTLRSWTINHMVQPEYRGGMVPPDKSNQEETEKYLTALQNALNMHQSGYQWIASLFGVAFDTRAEGNDLSNAGRLRVETKPFANPQPQPINVNGDPSTAMAGPRNVRRQMAVRSPLDRVTHATRDGGLHHFLEFCKGEVFQVRLTVLNPRGDDLGLIALWRRELNVGLLRLGALSSIGRGRVSINPDKEAYQIWLGPGAPPLEFLKNIPKNTDAAPDDALAGLWDAYTLSPAVMDSCIDDLKKA